MAILKYILIQSINYIFKVLIILNKPRNISFKKVKNSSEQHCVFIFLTLKHF